MSRKLGRKAKAERRGEHQLVPSMGGNKARTQKLTPICPALEELISMQLRQVEKYPFTSAVESRDGQIACGVQMRETIPGLHSMKQQKMMAACQI